MSEWEMIKPRTAAQGAVLRSRDGGYYKRTGDSTVLEEAKFQIFLADNGYPVPRPTVISNHGSTCYFVERSAGAASLHAEALAEADEDGHVSEQLVDRAISVSNRLLESQISMAQSSSHTDLYEWFNRAGLPENVFTENPDYATEKNRSVITATLRRLADVPMCHSHLDYGLPNAFPTKVIDWQHHALAPLGYDVYPMLDITAFKGGGKGYSFTDDQRQRYSAALDEAAARNIGFPLSTYTSDFLLVKCFFFLALMRPTTPKWDIPEKHNKWNYRRKLFRLGVEQYESEHRIDTGYFPTLDSFLRSTSDPRP